MESKIRRCPECRIYTLGDRCPMCGRKTESIFPPRYSPEDKWGKYRREYKMKRIEVKR